MEIQVTDENVNLRRPGKHYRNQVIIKYRLVRFMKGVLKKGKYYYMYRDLYLNKTELKWTQKIQIQLITR